MQCKCQINPKWHLRLVENRHTKLEIANNTNKWPLVGHRKGPVPHRQCHHGGTVGTRERAPRGGTTGGVPDPSGGPPRGAPFASEAVCNNRIFIVGNYWFLRKFWFNRGFMFFNETSCFGIPSIL